MARVIADLDSTRVFEEHYTVDEAGVLGDGISGARVGVRWWWHRAPCARDVRP
jgi:hypothetical protein